MTRRRRECLECGKRYTTHERLEDLPLRVVKKNGQRTPFSRDKLLAGVMKALEKRPVSVQEAEALVDATESEVLDRPAREVPASEIGEIVMRRLRDLDGVAYVRFASVYREFKEVDEFVKEIKSFSAKGGRHGKARVRTKT